MTSILDFLVTLSEVLVLFLLIGIFCLLVINATRSLLRAASLQEFIGIALCAQVLFAPIVVTYILMRVPKDIMLEANIFRQFESNLLGWPAWTAFASVLLLLAGVYLLSKSGKARR